MKLKDLLSKNLIKQIKEDIDMNFQEPPEVYFYVPPIQHVVDTTPTNKDNYYTSNNTNLSDMVNIQQFTITTDFINFIKLIENVSKTGYDNRKKLWFPHKSPEGGLKTIGYGHKIQSAEEERRLMSTGLTDKEAEDMLIKNLTIASRRAKSDVQKRFPGAVLDQAQMEMLTEFAFNLGSLTGFPKFTDAVVKGDWSTAKKEYHRNYTDKDGNKHRLDRRNTAFFNRYLKNK
jgi:GH24 family phage-related lysozyme (muramidase)